MAVQFAPGPLGAALSANNGNISANDKLTQLWAQLMLKNATDTAPIQSHWQGADKLAQAALAGLLINKERANERDSLNTMGGLVFGNKQAQPQSTLAPVPNLPVPQAPAPMSGGLPFGLSKIFGGAAGGGIGDAGPSPAAAMPPVGGTDGAALAPQAAPMMAMAQASSPSGDVKPLPISQPPAMADVNAGPVVPSQMPLPPPRPTGGAPSPQMLASLLSPELSANQPAQMTGGNPAQGIDYSRLAAELQNNPALVKRYADMINGETTFRDPKLAMIQGETVRDRATARNIPLEQALLAMPNKGGYYASNTYSRPVNDQQLADFKTSILPKLMGGSQVGVDTLGFRPTGNASEGYNNFASSRAARGIYDNYKWYSGTPGQGEMFAAEKGDTARFAKNARSNFPAELLTPTSDAERAMSFAPVQVASSDQLAGIPAGPQAPGIGSFTPGALPNVPTANVRPTGLAAPTAPQPAAPPSPMPQQVAQAPAGIGAASGGQIPKLPQNDPRAAMQAQIQQYQSAYQQALSRGNTTLARQILGAAQELQQKLLTTEQFRPLYDKSGNPYGQQSSLSNKVEAFPQPPGAADTQTVQYARQNWRELGLPDPASPDPKNVSFWKEFAAKRLGGAGVNVSIDQSAPSEQEKKMGEYFGTLYTGIAGEGRKAASANATLGVIDNLMKDPGFRSGFGAGYEKTLQQAWVALGGNPKEAATKEAFTALTNKTIYDTLGSLGNQISNSDRQFITDAFPNLSNTPEGNKLQVTIMRRMNERKLEIAQEARKYNNGRLDVGFENKLDDIAQKPLFSQDEMKQIISATGGQSPSAPQGQPTPQQPTRQQIEQELRSRGYLR